MALKIDLRAQEKLYVGTSTIVIASAERSTLIIDGDIPVVRERDLVQQENVLTPIDALLIAVQSHYLAPSDHALASIYKAFFEQSTWQSPEVTDAMRYVANGEYYKALRVLRSLGSQSHNRQSR